jgi:hypothetical protein
MDKPWLACFEVLYFGIEPVMETCYCYYYYKPLLCMWDPYNEPNAVAVDMAEVVLRE